METLVYEQRHNIDKLLLVHGLQEDSKNRQEDRPRADTGNEKNEKASVLDPFWMTSLEYVEYDSNYPSPSNQTHEWPYKFPPKELMHHL